MDMLISFCLWSNPSFFLSDFSGPRRNNPTLMVSTQQKIAAITHLAGTGDEQEYRAILSHIRWVRRRAQSQLEGNLHMIKALEYSVRREMKEPVRNTDGFDSRLQSLQLARRTEIMHRSIVQAKVREEKALEAAFHVVKLFRDLQQVTKKR